MDEIYQAMVKIVILIGIIEVANGYICDKSADTCETWLVIDYRITMSHIDVGAVYPHRGRLYKFDVKNTSSADPIPVKEVLTADGWEGQRLLTVVNETLPGPEIIVHEDQIVIIHVKNKLHSESITIHWHGLHQVGTPFMDGVPFVTQCPIQPGQTFTYKFKASPSGTFWYHSHVGLQRINGLFGAFVIREREDKGFIDHILCVQEWNHKYEADLHYTMRNYGIIENRTDYPIPRSLDNLLFGLWEPHSGLFNGRGRYYYNYEENIHNEAPLEVFNVTKGNSYRFRVIGVGTIYPFRISVDNHSITVIESDGYALEPVVVESFIINPGERYDFVLNANQSVDSYWIRGITVLKDRNVLAQAILRYEGASEVDPITHTKQCSVIDKCVILNCPFTIFPWAENTYCITFDQLRSAELDDQVPKSSKGNFKEHFLSFDVGLGPDRLGTINGIPFVSPPVSSLTQPTEIKTSCSEDCELEQYLCPCTHSLGIESGDTVQIVFTGAGFLSFFYHPIHIHGHSFHVLKMGYASHNKTTGERVAINADIFCKETKRINTIFDLCKMAAWTNQTWSNGNIPGVELHRPPRKDTIIVPAGGYTVVRFKADNPGLWLLHCHTELHSSSGMMLVLNESFSDLPKTPKGFQRCGDFEMKRENNSSQDKINNYINESADHVNFWIAIGVMASVIVLQFLLVIFLLFVVCHYADKQQGHEFNGKNNAQILKVESRSLS